MNEEIIHTHKDCDLDSNTHSIICTTIHYIYDYVSQRTLKSTFSLPQTHREQLSWNRFSDRLTDHISLFLCWRLSQVLG